MNEETVKLIPEISVRNQVEQAFWSYSKKLVSLLPDADIQHIGSTAVPGSLTKGDLDLQVRIPKSQFKSADTILAQHFERNTGSIQTEEFSSFKDDSATVPIGIQLTVIGSKFDLFWKIRDLMLADPALVESYNQLKQNFEGKLMEDYLVAKSLGTPDFKSGACE